ncbi:MAG: serine hydroxymethyltransferase [Gammaproteobacteria bacterium]|jgi:glycine hydroxymethyltransferase
MWSENAQIKGFDDELWDAIQLELQRQETHIELIASENYVSPRVLEAQGSVLTNKYAEGYPGKRYYGGCEFVDIVENLAIERAKKLFNADFANVQPHAGSQANAAAYAAMANPGDTILGLDLTNGGHLTHGSKVNFSGKFYHAAHYGVDDETGLIDFKNVQEMAHKHKPKIIVAGFTAYSRVVDWQRFREIADEFGAYLMADMSHISGLVAAGVYPSPVPIADVTTSTTHKTLRGARGGIILAKSNPELEKKINMAVFPGNQGGPLMHEIAAKAVTFQEAFTEEFKQCQKQIILNARAMCDEMMQHGHKIVANGTDSNLFLVDLIDKNISGKDAENALKLGNITCNKNTVPNDPRSPFVTSGIRLGTPPITTRGFKEAESRQVGRWICEILDDINNTKVAENIKQQALELCTQFPVYG